MTVWLDPLREALDCAPEPVTLFFRDDDAGWRDDRLMTLLDVFAAREVPIDVAAIPVAVTPALAAELEARARDTALLAVHQHGYAHRNHEPGGRRCEFGAGRAPGDQRRDIAAGRARLQDLLGPALEPIFTPPWNRCSPQTGACLADLGLTALSRDRTAEPLAVPGLAELPVQVDWLARRRGRPLGRAAVGEQLAARARDAVPLGVMLHHAAMDDGDMAAVAELLDLVAGHPQARCRPMAGVLRETTGEAVR